MKIAKIVNKKGRLSARRVRVCVRLGYLYLSILNKAHRAREHTYFFLAALSLTMAIISVYLSLPPCRHRCYQSSCIWDGVCSLQIGSRGRGADGKKRAAKEGRIIVCQTERYISVSLSRYKRISMEIANVIFTRPTASWAAAQGGEEGGGVGTTTYWIIDLVCLAGKIEQSFSTLHKSFAASRLAINISACHN